MDQKVSSIFSPRRLGHVNVVVDDIDVSAAFYRDICGLSIEFVEAGIRGMFMGVGRTPHDIGMIERTREDRYGKDGHLQIPKGVLDNVTLNHLAWEIDTDAELIASYRRARAEGVRIARTSDHQIAHSIYMKDPDGNMMEFYADQVKDWRNVLHGELDLITSAWDPESTAPIEERRWDPAPQIRHVDHACLHPVRLGHAVLTTRQPDRMTDVFTHVAGLAPLHASDDLVLLQARHDAAPGYQLALVRDDRDGLHHFSFEIASRQALNEASQALRARGVEIVRETRGPLKDSLFLQDPDGFLVEFFVRTGADYARASAMPPADRPYAV